MQRSKGRRKAYTGVRRRQVQESGFEDCSKSVEAVFSYKL
jgi:hypothetical protein